MAGSSSCSSPHATRDRLARSLVVSVTLALALLVLAPAAPALAGAASSGELLFYPCTSCHPVPASGATRALPNGFKGHGIELEGHDVLGKGDAACVVCHDDPSRDPGKLKLADGSLVDINGDISQVCFRCHYQKYRDFKAGTHGKRKASCVASGCHDPHTPGYIFADGIRPFTGAGFQFKVLPERVAFRPLASPPPAPPVKTPGGFVIFATLGLVAAGGQIFRLVRGRL